jgi:hypothetical protein
MILLKSKSSLFGTNRFYFQQNWVLNSNILEVHILKCLEDHSSRNIFHSNNHDINIIAGHHRLWSVIALSIKLLSLFFNIIFLKLWWQSYCDAIMKMTLINSSIHYIYFNWHTGWRHTVFMILLVSIPFCLSEVWKKIHSSEWQGKRNFV